MVTFWVEIAAIACLVLLLLSGRNQAVQMVFAFGIVASVVAWLVAGAVIKD